MNKYKYKIIIKNIFYYYCNYGNKYNFNYLTSKNFLKLIKDLMINIDKVSLDILYKKVVLNEKHLNYYKFKVIISLISKQLFNEEDNDICLNNIMEYYFIPLYNRVIKQSKIIEIKNLINNKIDIFIVKYIIDNYDIISIIYEYYFVNEIKNIIINNKFKSTEEESISNFLLFCNDFKIFNEFISIQDFLKLLYLTINLKEAKLNKLIQICSNDDRHYFEIGTEIKFIKFIFVIIKIIEYAKNYKYKDTNTEYLITLFFNNIRNKGSIFK